jgi:hypothetical protein
MKGKLFLHLFTYLHKDGFAFYLIPTIEISINSNFNQWYKICFLFWAFQVHYESSKNE